MIAGVVESQIQVTFMVTPSTENLQYSGSDANPSGDLTISGNGSLYFSLTYDNGDGVEIEYVKNGSLVETMYDTQGGYTVNRAFSVVNGDVIYFIIWVQIDTYHSVTIELRNGNSSGAVLFTGSYEVDNY